MTFQYGIATFVGAFIFPFLIRLLWGKMCENWGNIGGWMAAGFIVGTAWTLNHGVSMIHQTGAWIDMAWAAGIGLFTASVVSGDKFGKGVPNYIVALLGGTLGGYILSCFL
ncbi:hypothetical protein SAMN05660462_00211 [Proteiniborus ethanoligenes]|uniref:Uncharacterized protein n=1 Tax=Proteiniborus ethanoligenes TaxID=415015 RepID=A0A1H3KL55_9FIRM|nr:hypothetical protein [Proteiniborus ethanoligenes]SDY52294.1 hypothetical protein SAMN05660462_00211 [Proteiniborus ethanoligenes]